MENFSCTFFSSQIPQLLEQNTAEILAVSPAASVGASVKGHPRTTCSPLPEKRMLWASVAVHVAPLYCHSFSILLVSPMKKRVSLFEQKDTEAAMPFSPVRDRNLWAQEGGQGVLLRSLLLPPPSFCFYSRHTLLSPLFDLFSKDVPPLAHISFIFRLTLSSHRLPYSFSVLLCLLFRYVSLAHSQAPHTQLQLEQCTFELKTPT